MNKIKEFNEELESILEQRMQYLDSDILLKTKDSFKLYHSAFNAIFMLLLKKALIRADPYKHEYKITEISQPSTTPFAESDKETELGIRLSFYNTQLEYIDGRYVFTCEYLSNKRIKLLRNLISYIDWDSMSETSENLITRMLSGLLRKIRQGSDQIAVSLVNTSITQMSNTQKILFKNLNMVRDFHNESYKLLVRQKIFENQNIYNYASGNSLEDTLSVVKKKFSEVLTDQPFLPDLISEIIGEEFSSDSAEARNRLIAKLLSFRHELQKKEKSVVKKPPAIDMLVNAALTTCSASAHVKTIIIKLESNFNLLMQPQGSAFMKWLHKTLNSNKKQGRIFDIEYIDDNSGIKKMERVDINATMQKYQSLYTGLNSAKIKSDFSALDSVEKKENYLITFVDEYNKRLKSLIQQIQGIDKYVKQAAKKQKIYSNQIKGSLVEINTIKNIIIKSQQLSHEYIADREEYNQLKSLGVSGKPPV